MHVHQHVNLKDCNVIDTITEMCLIDNETWFLIAFTWNGEETEGLFRRDEIEAV